MLTRWGTWLHTELVGKGHMTAIHTLTNGRQNFLFEIDGDTTTLKTINIFGALEKTEWLSIKEGRNHWQFALKCGCKKGWTKSPYRAQPSAYDDEHLDEEPLYVD